VLHTLPSLTDLQALRPDIEVHWLVEPAFAPVTEWHPFVREAIPFPLRQMKKRPLALPSALWRLRRELHNRQYDLVLDSQGLYKSAILSHMAGVPVFGLDASSAREPGSSRFYQRAFSVPWGMQAVIRNRQLFAQALGYVLPDTSADFGLSALRQVWCQEPLPVSLNNFVNKPFVIGFHASSLAWRNKEWPVTHWITLAKSLEKRGYQVLLPAIDAREQERVEAIRAEACNVIALPRTTLQELALLIARAKYYVGMDTGLSYIASALGLKGVTLYGPTAIEQVFPVRTGQMSLQSPEGCAPCGKSRCSLPEARNGKIICQESIAPDSILNALSPLLV
jgi:heptosyltransferase-1